MNDVVVGLGPVPRTLEGPSVQDIADEIPVIGVVELEEIEQTLGFAGAPAEVEVAEPDGSVAGDGMGGGGGGLRGNREWIDGGLRHGGVHDALHARCGR